MIALDSYSQVLWPFSSMRRHGTLILPPCCSSSLRAWASFFASRRATELVQGAAGFYAERAGVELVQREVAGALLDRSLSFWSAFKLGRTADPVEEDDQLAEANAQCLDNHAGANLG